jgi:hypothetical protein
VPEEAGCCALPIFPLDPSACELHPGCFRCVFLALRTHGLPPLANTGDELVCLRLALAAWEKGLVMGSRSCHTLLFKCFMSKLPKIFPPLFHSYLKGATVQLPGEFHWQRQLGTLDTSSRDGLQPPLREVVCGWRPYGHFNRDWVHGFWNCVGWMTRRLRPHTAFHVKVFENCKILLRHLGLYCPVYHPQLMVGQMLPLKGALSSPLLALLVDANLPLEVYSLPVVQALIAAHWGVNQTLCQFIEAVVSHGGTGLFLHVPRMSCSLKLCY